MKQFLNIFFVTLGVIFFIIILLGILFFITDPLNLKPMIFSESSSSSNTNAQADSHPLLNDSQEQALKNFGIDPSSVPSEITAEQEACFTAALGEERVAEIKGGDSPTAADYFKAKGCI